MVNGWHPKKGKGTYKVVGRRKTQKSGQFRPVTKGKSTPDALREEERGR